MHFVICMGKSMGLGFEGIRLAGVQQMGIYFGKHLFAVDKANKMPNIWRTVIEKGSPNRLLGVDAKPRFVCILIA